MKKVRPVFLSAIFAILFFSACNKQIVPAGEGVKTINLPLDGNTIIRANNAFAFDFFKATLQNDPEENNKLISPLSIYMALSMVYNGADHATRDSMAKTLQLSGIDIESLNKVCAAIISQFPDEDPKVQMDIANSIWYNKNSLSPLPAFLRTMQNDYKASLSPLDFGDATSANSINKWVSEKTKNKIKKIVDNLNADELMLLVNAIYFNGKWKQEFKSSDTQNRPFYLADGRSVQVPFMHGEMEMKVGETPAYTLAELPYGGENGFSMIILNPKEAGKGLNSFVIGLDKQAFADALQSMSKLSVDIIMPKWEYAYEIKNMQPELSQLGMGIAFSGAADFTRMYNTSPGMVQLSKAIHKTYIKVDEKGTEAAAITAVGVVVTSLPQKLQLRLDHPFIYLIIEKQTGAIIFLGTMNDPSPES